MPLQFFRMLLIYIYLYIVRDTPYTIGLLNCSKCSLTCGHVLLQVNDTISHIYFLFYTAIFENVLDMFGFSMSLIYSILIPDVFVMV